MNRKYRYRLRGSLKWNRPWRRFNLIGIKYNDFLRFVTIYGFSALKPYFFVCELIVEGMLEKSL